MPQQDNREAVLAALREHIAEAASTPLWDRAHEEEKAKVRNRALLLLDQRARSRSEMATRLGRLDFDPGLIDEVLDDLERSRLIDDAAFAEEWVRQRHTLKGKSRRALRMELREKGVSSDIAEQALEQVSDHDETQVATALATQKVASIRSAPGDRKEYDKLLRRVVGMLARRGYGESVAYGVAKQALDKRLAELAQ